MISRFIKFSNGFKAFPIGMGTWGIGGFDIKDPLNDDNKQIKAISHMLQKGMNFVDLCPWYAEWKSVELFVSALKDSGKKVNEIFIVSSIYPHRNETLDDARVEFEKLLKLLGRNKTESIQFTYSGFLKWGMQESVKFYEIILKEGLTDYVSITNENLITLKILNKHFGDKLLSHEIHYSFEIRETENVGLVEFANKNGLLNVVHQPLRRNKTARRNWPLLVKLANKYKKSQNQIILNWLVTRSFLPLIKSETVEHIDENIASLKFDLEKKDIEMLNNFKTPKFKMPRVDWDRSGDGIPIHQMPEVFDSLYKK